MADPGEEASVPCVWCGEGLTRWDRLILEGSGYPPNSHSECLARAVAGSVGHQMGWCHCPGSAGTMEDPPGLTRREAARLAAVLNMARHGVYPFIVCPSCGLTSFHPGDIANRYCGRCHRFHDDTRRVESPDRDVR